MDLVKARRGQYERMEYLQGDGAPSLHDGPSSQPESRALGDARVMLEYKIPLSDFPTLNEGDTPPITKPHYDATKELLRKEL